MPIAFRSVSAAGKAGAGTSITVPAPAGIVDGDILLALGSNGHGLTTGMTYPDGTWTSIRNFDHTTGGPGGGLGWKRASGESGDYTFDFPGAGSSVNRVAWIIVISGALASGNPINAEAIAAELETTAVSQVGTCPDVTTTAICLIIRWMESRTGGSSAAPHYTIAGGTATERVDQADGSSNQGSYTEDSLVDGATGTRDITITMPSSMIIRSFVGTVCIEQAAVPEDRAKNRRWHSPLARRWRVLGVGI